MAEKENNEVLSEEELDEVTGGVHDSGMTANVVESIRVVGSVQQNMGFGIGQAGGTGEMGACAWQGQGIGNSGAGQAAGISGASTGLADGKSGAGWL